MVRHITVEDTATLSGGLLMRGNVAIFDAGSLVAFSQLSSDPSTWPGKGTRRLRGGEVYYNPDQGTDGVLKLKTLSGWQTIHSSTSGTLSHGDLDDLTGNDDHTQYIRTVGSSSERNLINTGNGSYYGLIIKGSSGQSSDLLELRENGGSMVFQVAATGAMTALSTSTIATASDSQPALITKGYTGQIAAIQQWQSSTTSVLAYVSASGKGFFEGLDANSQLGTNFLDPVSAQDAATKNYVDTELSGRHYDETFTATSSKVVSHNLGEYPQTFVMRSSGLVTAVTITHNSVNQLTLTFSGTLTNAVVVCDTAGP